MLSPNADADADADANVNATIKAMHLTSKPAK